jgi:hypothetical protein
MTMRKVMRKRSKTMKLSLLFASVLALGCAKSVPPKAVDAPIHRAALEDCRGVYGRIITISLVESLEPEELFSKEKLDAGAQLLDQFYTQTGRKQVFFQYCTSKLNVEQTSCMIKAESLEGMDLCDKQFAQTKKNP